MKQGLPSTIEEAIERMRLMAQVARMGYWNLDLTTNNVFWTAEPYKIFSLDLSQTAPLYSHQKNPFTAESWERLEKVVAEIKLTGEPFELELELAPIEGHRAWIISRGEVSRDEHDKIPKLHGVVIDITDRMRSELRLDRVINATPNAFVLVDQAGVISMVNSQTESLFGYKRDELEGQPLEILIPKELKQLHASHRSDYLRVPRDRVMGGLRALWSV